MGSAYTLGAAGEAIGIARAAEEAGIPARIAFTVETDGQLADRTLLPDAVQRSHPRLRVLGGCCGTDLRHLREIARRVSG